MHALAVHQQETQYCLHTDQKQMFLTFSMWLLSVSLAELCGSGIKTYLTENHETLGYTICTTVIDNLGSLLIFQNKSRPPSPHFSPQTMDTLGDKLIHTKHLFFSISHPPFIPSFLNSI